MVVSPYVYTVEPVADYVEGELRQKLMKIILQNIGRKHGADLLCEFCEIC